MNTTHQTRWAVALAAAALTLTTACGSEITSVPGDIGGADRDTPTDTRQDDNPARLDFRDTGRG